MKSSGFWNYPSEGRETSQEVWLLVAQRIWSRVTNTKCCLQAMNF